MRSLTEREIEIYRPIFMVREAQLLGKVKWSRARFRCGPRKGRRVADSVKPYRTL